MPRHRFSPIGLMLATGCGALPAGMDAGDAARTDARRDATADSHAADVARVDAASDTSSAGDASDANTDAGNTLTLDRSHCTANPDQAGMTQRTAHAMSGANMPYVAFVPSTYSSTTGMPLVIALHGAGDMAGNYLSVIWQGAATSENFAVIAPEGSCPVGSGNTWCNDDPNSIIDAITDFEQCYTIDTSRRVLNGFSAGGIIAFLIGMQATNLFSGLSIMSANLGSAEAFAGMPLLPAQWLIPVSQFQGTTDMNFPIATVMADRDRMIAAGHTVYWHAFDGGHTTNAGFALTTYTDLAASRSPTGGH